MKFIITFIQVHISNGTNVFTLTIEINKYTNETIYLNNF